MGCYFEKQSIQHAFIQFGSYLAGSLGLKIRYWPDRTDRNMGLGQTEQTDIWVLARPNRPKFGYWPDRTGRNLGIGQTEQDEIWVLARPNRPKYGYWPDRTDRNMGMRQSEQTEIWVCARPNRPKYGYSPDRTDSNCLWPDGRRDPNFFQTIVAGRTGTPCPRPKSVWPIPVLGRGLHPGVVVCKASGKDLEEDYP